MRFDDAKEDLLDAMNEKCAALRGRLDVLAASLEAASPKAIMNRGYSVVVNEKTGKLVRRAKDAKSGDPLSIRPLEGVLKATVE
jgi:exodeoxyribonuclease VII large subunit